MDTENLLEIKELAVEVGGKEILHHVSLTVKAGETHVLFGPNGSGKTTLFMAIMGLPKYRVTRGSILFKGRDILGLSIDERARLGIGLALQKPPVVRGVKIKDIVATCMKGRASEEAVMRLAEKANMVEFLDREVNYGLSGGETKRSELLQLLAQEPELALLDEPESGVDLVNMALIGDLINELLHKEHPIRGRKHSGLIITHTGHILEYVRARTGYVLLDGRIVCEGDPLEILETIKRKGYEECRKCAM